MRERGGAGRTAFAAVGRRKTSVARVVLQPGNGNIIINGQPLEQRYTRSHLQSTVSRPLRVWKRAVSPPGKRPLSHSTCALASVACPHRSTSTVGVNQRRPKPSGRGSRNAVSARFISVATLCILGNISYMLGRKLRWDTAAQQVIDDEEANRLLARPNRSPWHI